MSVNEKHGRRPPEEADAIGAATALASAIAAEIRRHGPLTFAAFMDRALYAPDLGYYMRDELPWGSGGDYQTAPQVHPAYGAAVALLVSEVDALLGQPRPFVLVEMGSGDGSLLEALCCALAQLHSGLYERLRIWSVERSAGLRELQHERLERLGDRIQWAEALERLPDSSILGGFVSNELLDALPVHRVVGAAPGIEEIFVDVEDGRFVERRYAPSTPRLLEYLSRNGVELYEGQVAEICLLAEDWIRAVAGRLARGFVLTVDYGSWSESLYGPDRTEGSLVCQRRYRVSRDPYRRVGDQDISAHVDFGNLKRLGRELGLETIGLESLSVFLAGFGVLQDRGYAAGLSAGDGPAARSHLALRHLLFSEIGAAHRVLLQTKGMAAGALRFGRERLDVD